MKTRFLKTIKPSKASPPKRRIAIIAEFSVHPIGKGTSVGRYVRAAVTAVSKIKGLKWEVTPMSTVLEAAKIETILQAVIAAHATMKALGAQRISSTLRIDERLDKPRIMRDKVSAVSD